MSSAPVRTSSPKKGPYQSSLLRALHGCSALAVLGCWLTGLVVYGRYDGRWGRLPLQLPGDWIDIHGSLGVVLLPFAVLLAVYACTLGGAGCNAPATPSPCWP